MPLLIETGLCTDDDQTKNELRRYETERVQLVAVRRRSGLIAKSMDGLQIPTTQIRDPQVGTFSNCMQMGRTQFSFRAPKQILSPFQGKQILQYQRQWVQLEE